MNDSSLSKPVFIVGMNGSGTTMLLDNLGNHPRLYAFPRETRLIPYLISKLASYGDLNDDGNYGRVWNDVREILAFRAENNNRAVPLPENWMKYPRSLADVLDANFRYFANRAGKDRWCEKTPQHVQHMRQLLELFPNAQFIHMIRDGRDVAVSFHRRWRRTPKLTMYRWKKVVTEGRRQGLKIGPKHYMEVRYEDLTNEPVYWLRKICTFLAEPYDESIQYSNQPYLKEMKQNRERTPTAVLSPNSGKWKEYFSENENRKLDRIGGATLASFGYQTKMAEMDNDPRRIKVLYWGYKDYLVQFTDEIVMKLSGKIERPWKVILSKPWVAFRQRRSNKY